VPEVSTLTKVPPARGQSGFQSAQFAAAMVGIEAPRSGANLDVKPYAISSASAIRTNVPNGPNGSNGSNAPNDLTADVGLDAKYGITQNLTADFTVNTDFAQVEADEQQINLTRFSLFFPEKRDFFLENAGLFTFGGTNSFNAGRNDVPLLFYSRRIGLNAGQVVPIDAGARLSGRIGRYSVGVMDIQGGDEAVSGTRATNFSAVRINLIALR